MKKFFRRMLTVLFVVAGLLTAVVVAAVQTFGGQGRYVMSDFDTESIAQQRAIQRAKEDAQDKAGVYLTGFSQSVNAVLTADEISAVTNNIIDIADVQLESKIADADGESVVIWTATIKANIDPDGIFDFIKRDETDKVTIVQQNTQLQEAIRKNDEQIEDLKAQYKRAATQAEKDRIREQMKQTDRDFLANEKLAEGVKLHYAKDYNGAIKLYDEAIQLNPNFAEAYIGRNVYRNLGQYERAIQDYDKAIELNPNLAEAHQNRGICYKNLGDEAKAQADFDKAKELGYND